GEVAEPFQVLVVANFPNNFTEAAAKKLVSIATSGPRSVSYPLVSVDRQQRMPADFNLSDLLASAVHLDWQPAEQNFRWRGNVLERLPLMVDNPPSAGRFNDVIRPTALAATHSLKLAERLHMI